VSSIEDVLSRSPFLASQLPPDELQRQYGLFIQSFQTAVETTNDDEESWAYEKCKGAFRRLMGDPPPSRSDPNMPEGFFEAMRWAAQFMVASRPS
jgi:hypothetical protein